MKPDRPTTLLPLVAGLSLPLVIASRATPATPAAAAAPAGDSPAPVPEASVPRDTPREKPLQYAVTYRLDTRAGTGTGEPALELGGLEVEFVGSYGRKWEFAGQVPLASQFAARGWGMHFGNLFVVRKWRLGAPTVKFGQFVVPFSNLTTSDVHSRLIQSLYRYSLGVRIDPGVAVDGYLPGDTEWQVALTTGNGPYRFDHLDTPLLTGRIGHKFERGGNALKLGLSAAAGRLPVFSVTGDPVSRDGARLLTWSSKRRLALDAELERGVDLFRLEGAAGTDGGRAARGLWLGWTRPLNARSSLEAAAETWRQPARAGRLWGAWLGGEHRLDGARTARVALHWCRTREDSRSHAQLSLIGQFVRQF